MDDEDMSENSEMQQVDRQMMAERRRLIENDGNQDEDQDMNDGIDFDDSKEKLSVWISRLEVIKHIRKIFSNFLRTFKDEQGVHVYEHRVSEMCLNNRQSLEVTFLHLSSKYPTLAIWLAEEPSLMLPILNEVGVDITYEMYPQY